MRRRQLLLIAAAIPACARAPSAEAPKAASPAGAALAPFVVVDLMPDFWAFWGEARGVERERARELFLARVVAKHPDVYARGVLGLPEDDGAAMARRLDQWLPTLAPAEPDLRRVHAAFARELEGATARFMDALPDFSWRGKVYLFASVDAFNGAARVVGGEESLLFGLDVIAKSQPGLPPTVLMHHELFHFYQDKSKERVIGQALWVEGLATYASIVLNPGTRDDDALPITHLHDAADPQLDAPSRRVLFSGTMPALVPELGRRLLGVLRGGTAEDYADFFLGRATERMHGRPVRSAYWFGLTLVRRIAEGQPLRVLAKRSPASTIDDLERELRRLLGES